MPSPDVFPSTELLTHADCHQWLMAHSPIPLTEVMLAQLETLYSELKQANETTNLTRITSIRDFYHWHVLDSLSLLQVLGKKRTESLSLLDVGAGAGFPSLVLAITCPQWQVYALEATKKKVGFIDHIQTTLPLPNLHTITARAEEAGQNTQWREHFDVVTARAVSHFRSLLELCTPFAKPHGMCIFMKTDTALHTEIPEASHAFKKLHAQLKEVYLVSGPEFEQRRLAVVTKMKSTPNTYPRRVGLPTRQPL